MCKQCCWNIDKINSFDKIDPQWLQYSEEIKKKSKNWLIETFSYKSIKNCPGISFGFKNKIPGHDSQSLKIYQKELNNLIKML